MNRSKIKAGDHVAVVGCGFMGLVCLQLAKYLGAGAITAIDPLDSRLTLAGSFGAGKVQHPDEFNHLLQREGWDACGNDDYDVVIEAAGNQAALDLSGHLVRQHGLINIVGHHYSENGRRTVFMNQWNCKAIDVVNGHVRREDEKCTAMRQGVELLASGHLILEPLVTCFPLSKIEEAFQQSMANKGHVIKAVIIPDDSNE